MDYGIKWYCQHSNNSEVKDVRSTGFDTAKIGTAVVMEKDNGYTQPVSLR